MDFLTAYAIYATGVILLVGLWAVRVPHEDVRMVFLSAAMWPLSLVAVIVIAILNSVRWDLDIVKGSKMFGFRRPTNPEARGFAVTIFGQEVQVYSVRKGA